MNKYLLNESVNFQYSLINTAIFFTLILYYLKSHNTFKPLKIFVYEGLGIGFISFMVISFSILVNLSGIFKETSIGITSLIIIFIISAYGMINARNISIKNVQPAENSDCGTQYKRESAPTSRCEQYSYFVGYSNS